MVSPVSRLRRWFALGAILMVGIVAGMYFYARMSLRKTVHAVPAKLGLDIQQTAEGFSISKSEEGRTVFTVSASKAVQFKEGDRAELHNVKIVVYGKDSSRFDRITSDEFEYDPKSGDVTAKGRVLIDLQANPEGAHQSDQTQPTVARDPIHLESDGLVFNKNTGDASAVGKVVFQTPQANGSAVGIRYMAKTGTMKLLSAVAMTADRPQPLHLNADSGVITKQPKEVVLSAVHLTREGQQMQADQGTFFLREDNTVDHILGEGNVRGEFRRAAAKGKEDGPPTKTESDRAELFLTGTRNQLTKTILTGNVRMVSEGEQASEAQAGKATLYFAAQQLLEKVHAEDGVRLMQKNSKGDMGTAPGVSASAKSAQDIEMTAPSMDFFVKDGRLLQTAETAGPPQIVITQPGANQKTVVTAGKFTAKFAGKNRLATLHGEPGARIVSSLIDPNKAVNKPGASTQGDRVSTSQMLDVVFRPEGGIESIAQSGAVAYSDGPQKAWAQRGVYTTTDQVLVMTGAPRVVDGGMTTTAETIRMNRVSGDATMEGNVKSTYSDLKAQPDGAMLASGDPIHVTSKSMTVHRASSVAVYTGDTRLWQDANMVQAPVIQFDRNERSIVAQGATVSPTANAAQPVSTALVQVDKNGKVTPVRITSGHLKYVDLERKIYLDDGVTVKGPDSTMTAQKMTVFLLARNQMADGKQAGKQPVTPTGAVSSGKVDRIIAEQNVVVTEPTRHATGDRLVYTAADEKYVLTGESPSIFDAERGKITGDSLTFYRRDDRVLVEGREASPTTTRTQVAR